MTRLYDVIISTPEHAAPWELDVPAGSARSAGMRALFTLAGSYGVALETAVVVVDGERLLTPSDEARR